MPSPFGNDAAGMLASPFSDGAVGSVWEGRPIDVPQIHADVSARLLSMIQERAEGVHHRCVLLYGDAGSGKTHVLRRLREHLETSGQRVPFSWVRMQTSPAMMWRHVRRTLADDLARRPVHGTTQLAELMHSMGDRLSVVEDRDLAVVLEHLAEGRHVRNARAWLAGSAVPESALQAMGLVAGEEGDDSAEDQSRRVLKALAAFIAPAPLVVCLDQLEALQSYPGERAGLFAIGKLMAWLHDETPNVVAVGCVQSGLIGELASALSKAEMDRYQPMALKLLDGDGVRALVRARLESRPEIAEARPAEVSKWWPIDLEGLEALVNSREGVSARRVIFECEQMFRAAQCLLADTIPLDARLSEKLENRADTAGFTLAADSSTGLLSDALPRVLRLRGIATDRSDLPPWIDHVVCRNGREIAVVLANEEPRALWRKLDRICRGWNPATLDLVLLRDALNPLRSSAAGCIERLQELERRGARILTPSREALIGLEAAGRLLTEADTGDLTFRGERVAVDNVEDWVREHLAEPVGQLLDELTNETRTTIGGLRLSLIALLADVKVASVDEAAEHLQTTKEEVETCARQNPDQIGFLGGSKPAIFERISARA